MSDLIDVLKALPTDVSPGPAGAEVVAADVARGHRALIRRRHRRIACSSAVLAVAVSVAVGAGHLTRPGDSAAQAAEGSSAATRESRVRLVAYTGTQPVGFKVHTVPEGWQVVSSDTNAFVVAPPGTDTPAPAPKEDLVGGEAVSLEGRIAVMLQGSSRLPSHSPVTEVDVNGEQGRLGLADGGNSKTRAKWLIFPDGAGHKVLVQVPTSLGLTDGQITRFARGITVTGDVRTTHG
ncbi:hypothetical protein [Actinomadura algeriensis]|uniref:Uncharacterized protein n=1 Tax=Actinomadura algeriensis TaxID=1679523 RepID=A0ABR9K403_9ACTN|nr:hypothetical protein [Actinomadura algeriensis]MBE1537579.1 hypothetical protein [Actinomadura algeriensis]